MFEHVSEKDIVAFNQRFDRGTVLNPSSLSYAVAEANRSKSWLRSCAMLVRAVLIDHVFEEGNKRTAAAVITAYLEEKGLIFHPEAVSRAIVDILMRNMTSITVIERRIKDVIV